MVQAKKEAQLHRRGESGQPEAHGHDHGAVIAHLIILAKYRVGAGAAVAVV